MAASLLLLLLFISVAGSQCASWYCSGSCWESSTAFSSFPFGPVGNEQSVSATANLVYSSGTLDLTCIPDRQVAYNYSCAGMQANITTWLYGAIDILFSVEAPVLP